MVWFPPPYELPSVILFTFKEIKIWLFREVACTLYYCPLSMAKTIFTNKGHTKDILNTLWLIKISNLYKSSLPICRFVQKLPKIQTQLNMA